MWNSLELVTIMLGARVTAARRGERGASAVEWVVIGAIVAGIAIAVGAILMSRLTDRANNIPLQ